MLRNVMKLVRLTTDAVLNVLSDSRIQPCPTAKILGWHVPTARDVLIEPIGMAIGASTAGKYGSDIEKPIYYEHRTLKALLIPDLIDGHWTWVVMSWEYEMVSIAATNAIVRQCDRPIDANELTHSV